MKDSDIEKESGSTTIGEVSDGDTGSIDVLSFDDVNKDVSPAPEYPMFNGLYMGVQYSLYLNILASKVYHVAPLSTDTSTNAVSGNPYPYSSYDAS